MEIQPGERVWHDRSKIGRRLTWKEACESIGKVIWYEIRTESLLYWVSVRPEKYLPGTMRFWRNGQTELRDRLVCSYGRRSPMLLCDFYEPVLYAIKEDE